MQHIRKLLTGEKSRLLAYKCIQLSILFIVLLFLLSGCFMTKDILQEAFPDGRGDWKYPLPNEYYIFMANSSEIYLVKSDQHTSGETFYNILLPSYVYAFCYSPRYVGIIQTPSKDTTIDPSDARYYLVDTQDDKLLGPLTMNEYQQKCEELQILSFSNWIYSKNLNCDNVPKGQEDG